MGIRKYFCIAVLFVMALVLVPTTPIQGQSTTGANALPDPLFTPVEPWDDAPDFRNDPALVRWRFVRVDLQLLRDPARHQHLLLNLFDDRSVIADQDRISQTDRGSVLWRGETGAPLGRAYIAYDEDVMVAQITPDLTTSFSVHPVMGDIYVIKEGDHNRAPECDLVSNGTSSFPSSQHVGMASENLNHLWEEVPGSLQQQEVCDTIDVMVVYSKNARIARGGTAAMRLHVENTVAETNDVYDNSQIDFQIELVHMSEIDAEDTSQDELKERLDQLRAPNDGVMDEVHDLRDEYDADIVSLWPDGFCGGRGNIWESPGQDSGWNVVCQKYAGSYARNYAFAHELGHNMGARHDWFKDDSDNDPAYRHGHISREGGFRSIMSYRDLCNEVGFDCLRIPYFSNPDISFEWPEIVGLLAADPAAERVEPSRLAVAQPTGVEEGTSTACTKGEVDNPDCDADNARRLRETACHIAGLRDSEKRDDFWMKDRREDQGGEPDPSTAGKPMWQSPWIIVRNADDDVLVHQDPIAGQKNYVYVRYRNESLSEIEGSMRLYWTEASTGLKWYPAANGAPNWTEIDRIDETLSPSTSGYIKFEWTPQESMVGHFCLLARFESDDDPMTTVETENLGHNVRYNNNIIWRNVNIVDLVVGGNSAGGAGGGDSDTDESEVAFIARNPDDTGEEVFDLLVRLPEPQGDDIHEQLRVQVCLGELGSAWVAGGGRGSGYGAWDDGEYCFQMTDPKEMRLENIAMQGGEDHVVHVRFAVLPELRIDQPQTWNAEAVQLRGGEELGGVAYSITLIPPPDTRATVSGSIFDDLNSNGTKGTDTSPEDEPGLSGWQVVLRNVLSDEEWETRSHESGNWQIKLPAGKYEVTSVPEGDSWSLTAPWCGSYVIEVGPSEAIADLDFGWVESAEGGIPRLCVHPSEAETPVNGAVMVEVRMFGAQDVYAGFFELQFDPSIVEVQDEDPTRPGVQVGKGEFIDDYVVPTNVAIDGSIELFWTYEGEHEGKNGSGTVAYMWLRGLEPGMTDLLFSEDTNFSTPRSDAVELPTQGGQVYVYGVPVPEEPSFSVKGIVQLERRGSFLQTPIGDWSGARVCIEDNCTTTDGTGLFQLDGVQDGDELKATHPSYLHSVYPVDAPDAEPGDVVEIPAVTMISGDVDQNDRVYVADFQSLVTRLRLKNNPLNPPAGWFEPANIVPDAQINTQDTTGVMFNWLKEAPTAWVEAGDLQFADGSATSTQAVGKRPESGLATMSQGVVNVDTVLHLDPASSTVAVDDEAEIDIGIQDAENVMAIAVELEFDPEFLEVVDADSSTEGVQITIGDFLDPRQTVGRHLVDNEAGLIELVIGQNRGTTARSGDGVLGRVRFRTKREGTTEIRFGQVGLADDTTPLPKESYPATEPATIEIGGVAMGTLKNISTRSRVQLDDEVLIGGFIIEDEPVRVLMTAKGPTLTDSRGPIEGRLMDPTLTLYSGPDAIATNDNWQESDQRGEIEGEGARPTDPRESAIVRTLEPGGYTVIVRGKAGTQGVGLVEIFHAGGAGVLKNISSRAKVLQGDNVMIGGFIVQDGPMDYVVRALGPTLADGRGPIPGRLEDPMLTLYEGPNEIASNDDWSTSPQRDAIEADALKPGDPREAMIIGNLQPGAYTAIVRGKGGQTGLALVEIYRKTPANTPGLALEREGLTTSVRELSARLAEVLSEPRRLLRSRR